MLTLPITASGTANDMVHTEEVNSSSYLSKPETRKVLITSIRIALRKLLLKLSLGGHPILPTSRQVQPLEEGMTLLTCINYQ